MNEKSTTSLFKSIRAELCRVLHWLEISSRILGPLNWVFGRVAYFVRAECLTMTRFGALRCSSPCSFSSAKAIQSCCLDGSFTTWYQLREDISTKITGSQKFTHHADIVSVQQNLWQFRLSSSEVAAIRVRKCIHSSCLRTLCSQLSHIFEHHVCDNLISFSP